MIPSVEPMAAMVPTNMSSEAYFFPPQIVSTWQE